MIYPISYFSACGFRQPAMTATPVLLADVAATLLAAGGATAEERARALDGVDLRPVLANPAAALARPALFFHYPHYYPTTSPVSAIRAGDWKLLEYFEDQRLELFHLRDDPGEERDLATREPARARDLQRQLAAWREAVGAKLPAPNPDFRAKK